MSGTHILEVTEKTARVEKIRLAVLSRKVAASNATYSDIFAKAKDFVVKNNTPEKFIAAARDSGLVLHPAMYIQENLPRLDNISDSRDVIRWAFENNSKIVSDVYVCGSEFIVCALTGIREKGYSSMEDVQPQLKAMIIQDKKAEAISKEFTDKLKQNNNIQSFGSSVSLSVDTMKNINFATTQIMPVGNEPAIAGVAQYLKENQPSAPIKGNNGVYVISPYEITKSSNEFDAATQKMVMDFNYKYMIPQAFYQVLLDKADVVDLRFNFY
jgi:peptidyl-prolyl cis-trans isomerase D